MMGDVIKIKRRCSSCGELTSKQICEICGDNQPWPVEWLTVATVRAIITPVAHIGGAGLASRNIGVEIRRFTAVFLRANFSHRNGGVSQALPKVAGPMSRTPTLFTLPPLIGVFVGRFKNCNIGLSIMNKIQYGAKSAQNPIKICLFNLAFKSNVIRHNLTFDQAYALASSMTGTVIKFAGVFTVSAGGVA